MRIQKKHWVGLLIISLCSMLFMGMGLLLMGLPGAIIFEIFSFFYSVITQSNPVELIPPDSAWPIAILLTVMYPLTLIPAYIVSFIFSDELRIAVKLFIFGLIMAAALFLLPLILYNTAV